MQSVIDYISRKSNVETYTDLGKPLFRPRGRRILVQDHNQPLVFPNRQAAKQWLRNRPFSYQDPRIWDWDGQNKLEPLTDFDREVLRMVRRAKGGLLSYTLYTHLLEGGFKSAPKMESESRFQPIAIMAAATRRLLEHKLIRLLEDGDRLVAVDNPPEAC